MLVVISDIHLTDGSSGQTIHAGAFRAFVENLRGSVQDACWRADGSFMPVDRCDLVMLGDVLDIIRSDQWCSNSSNLRPWSGNDLIGDAVLGITGRILEHNAPALAHIKNLGGQVTVSDGKGGSHDIPLFIHYFVGNHDWFLRLPGPQYDAARLAVCTAFGLANDPKKPFPHLLGEADPSVVELIRAHRLYAQHGDIYDEMNFEARQGRNYSSLGDCIVVELVNRFPIAVKEELGLAQDDPDFLALREIDNVRPLLAIPSWIQGVLRRSTLDKPAKDKVMEVWERLVDEFLDLPFVRALDIWGFDKVDKLEIGLRITGGLSLRLLTIASETLNSLTWRDSLAKHALKEDALLRGDADYVAYGHTHSPEIISLDLVPFGANVREQVYFNTGTWRRVHQRCIREPGSFEFGSFHVMTYVSFFRSGERGGRRYEAWTGQLG
jgi:UDP-2,3-diacylglucosamine pyrophosphatase LpxH